MFGLFKPMQMLSTEDLEFQIATFQWLIKNFGGDDFYCNTDLIKPTPEYFPSVLKNHEHVAHETFIAVKKHAGMEDWPCKLQAQQIDVDPIVTSSLMVENAPNSPLGTFNSTSKSGITITYNPTIVNRPMQLVATYAHELAHYLTGAGESPPGGWDNWEYATDIAATFLGFGIFMANSAFNFKQHSSFDAQGWKVSRSGYLSENEHIFALAIFLSLKGIPHEHACKFLKFSLRKKLKQAIKEIQKSTILDEVLDK